MENITTDSTFYVPAFSKVTAIEYIKTLDVLVTHRSPEDVDFFLKNEEASGLYHLRDVRAALGTHFWNSQRLFFEKIWWCIQMILYGESLLKPAPSEYLNCLDTLLNAAEAKHWTSSSIF